MIKLPKKKLTNPKDFGKVAVLMGGLSNERDISLLSGNNVLESMLASNIDAVAIDVNDAVIQQLQEVNPARVFIALHGTGGEDGVIQSVLEVLHIPYPSSGVAASALTMDKYRCNKMLKSEGFPVLESRLVTTVVELMQINAKLKFPLCIKPLRGGSSRGVSKVLSSGQLEPAFRIAQEFDYTVMVEPWVDGKEYTVSIFMDRALPVIEIFVPNGFYDYEAKYFRDDTEYHCPSGLDESSEQELQDIALTAFNATGCSHWGRVDFKQDHNGKFWLIEINTIPGFTSSSLLPKAALHVGLEYNELIWRILEFTVI